MVPVVSQTMNVHFHLGGQQAEMIPGTLRVLTHRRQSSDNKGAFFVVVFFAWLSFHLCSHGGRTCTQNF